MNDYLYIVNQKVTGDKNKTTTLKQDGRYIINFKRPFYNYSELLHFLWLGSDLCPKCKHFFQEYKINLFFLGISPEKCFNNY